MDIHKLWELMSSHEYGPEPLVIEVEEGKVYVTTLSMMNEGVQEGLYVSGGGKTLEEAFKKFEINLDEQLVNNDDE